VRRASFEARRAAERQHRAKWTQPTGIRAVVRGQRTLKIADALRSEHLKRIRSRQNDGFHDGRVADLFQGQILGALQKNYCAAIKNGIYVFWGRIP
jgi:hypothetical protein